PRGGRDLLRGRQPLRDDPVPSDRGDDSQLGAAGGRRAGLMRRAALALVALALAVPVGAAGSAGFAPNDPLAAKQWYLTQIHAFDAWPELPATLAPVRVAVVDSGPHPRPPGLPSRVPQAPPLLRGRVPHRPRTR